MRALALASATAILAPAAWAAACFPSDDLAGTVRGMGFEPTFIGSVSSFLGNPVSNSAVVLLIKPGTGEWILVSHDTSGEACIVAGGTGAAYTPAGDPA